MGVGSSTSKVKNISQDLRGKHYVVTGANTGLGYATTRELAKMGATVTLACRSADKGKQAVDNLRAEAMAEPVSEVRGSVPCHAPLVCILRTNNPMDEGGHVHAPTYVSLARYHGISSRVLLKMIPLFGSCTLLTPLLRPVCCC